MPYTVASSFDKFRSAIELTSTHRETATKRKDSIVSLLSKNFTILDAFASGSIPRYTAVTGYADLDVIVVLHHGNHVKGKLPSQVLKDVRDALGDYTTSVRRNGQAVTLKFTTWPSVDIVPVSRTVNADGSVNHYSVPNMNTELWIQSRPKKHSTDMANRNALCGDMFKRIVKMIKWWNHQHSSYLQSFHIEVIALRTFTGTLSDYSWEVYRYFDEALKLLQTPLWHEGDYIDSYLNDNDRKEAIARLQTAKDIALSAWYQTYGENNNHEEAIRLWRQIFGDKFPAYG